MPSARVLPSSRESSVPISSLRARISLAVFFRISWRCSGPDRLQPGNAAFAAAIARFASSAVPRA